MGQRDMGGMTAHTRKRIQLQYLAFLLLDFQFAPFAIFRLLALA